MKIFVSCISCLIVVVFLTKTTFSQKLGFDSLHVKNFQIEKPNLIPTNPLALFSLRKAVNFKIHPDKLSIKASLLNGNIMLPPINIYYPLNAKILNILKEIPWYDRPINGFENNKESLYVDGLMRNFNLEFNFGLKDNYELVVALRGIYFETGNKPYSFLNNDEVIESFHENIHGGSDPFARNIYGFDQAEFHYTNTNGEEFSISENEFLLSGIEVSYFYYPTWKRFLSRSFFQNFGGHLGINTTSFNTSIDLAGSYAISKGWSTGSRGVCTVSAGSTIYLHQLAKTSNAQQIYSKMFNYMAEGMLGYHWKHKTKDRTFSFSYDYMLQSPFRRGYAPADGYNGLIFEGERYTSHWHTTAKQFFNFTHVWSIIYTWRTPKMSLSVYFQEDLIVNNAPDTQTGVSVTWKFK